MRRVDFMVGERDFKSLTAEQLMETSVHAVGLKERATKLAQAMTEGGFGDVPVLNKEGQLRGIVTEFDLLKAIMGDQPLANLTALDLMTPSPVTVRTDTPSQEVVRLMEEHHLIRLPVVDAQGPLVGIVARRDILAGYRRATSPSPRF